MNKNISLILKSLHSERLEALRNRRDRLTEKPRITSCGRKKGHEISRKAA
ncbi:MAG: hypothetical protein HQK54_10630 [Oligoflexales bacterium]|nr:hypothetical protein [Oligoflexales bacterium]